VGGLSPSNPNPKVGGAEMGGGINKHQTSIYLICTRAQAIKWGNTHIFQVIEYLFSPGRY
jgi:hypothetical protein